MKSLRVLSLVAALSLCGVAQSANQVIAPTASQVVVPRLIRFAGQANGATGTVGITFTLHKSQQDNSALWIETQNVKLDAAGKYTVLLGATKPDGIPTELFTSGEAQWLAIRVDGQPEQPRVLLVSVPYALKAAEAESLAGHSATDFVTTDKLNTTVEQQVQSHFNTSQSKQNSVNGVLLSKATNFTDTTTDQVVGVTQKGTGKALVATAKSNTAIYGNTTATSGSAVGVYGESSSPGGVGLYGLASSTSGSPVALFGSTPATGGIAIAANETATSGNTIGLQSAVYSGSGTAAVFKSKAGGKLISGQTGSSNTEVFSVDGSGNVTVSESGSALYLGENAGCGATYPGISVATSPNCTNFTLVAGFGNTYLNRPAGGVLYLSEGDYYQMEVAPGGGFTIFAPSTDQTAFKVAGWGGPDYGDPAGVFTGGSNANNTYVGASGVQATGGTNSSSGGQGGYGVSAMGGTSGKGGPAGIGIHAESNPTFSGVAGEFWGDISVSGKITAGTKDFKIDHPLDPSNKYLYHASVESSEMVNVYSGNVTTDASGEAVVQLPEWFEAVNGDFRYQLTAVGQFAQAIIGRKIANHQFSIKTDKPNVEVSWQVTGVRQDAFAKAHPLQVEVEKSERDRGSYLYPELYGASADKREGMSRRQSELNRERANQKPRESARAIGDASTKQ